MSISETPTIAVTTRVRGLMKEFTSKIEIRISPAMREQIDNLSVFIQRRPSSWIRDLLEEELWKWADTPEAIYGPAAKEPAAKEETTHETGEPDKAEQ